MKILFVGGTGIISRACTFEALEVGHEVVHLNRGSHPGLAPAGVKTLKADIRDPIQTKAALKGMVFDCVVNWVAFEPDHVLQDMEIFTSLTSHYIFISSATVYRKPPPHWIVTESTPLGNPYWKYARDKIACEEALLKAYSESGFPCTVVRPSHTYDDGWVPTPVGSSGFTMANRMLEGKEVVSPGDGQSLWTLTHSADFAKGFTGLLANPQAVGEAYHITSHEVLTWDRIYETIAAALGVETKIIHVPSDLINKISPTIGEGLLGDKAYSTAFDNSKIKALVPEFSAAIPFEEGIRRSLDWFRNNPEARSVNIRKDEEIDRIVSFWKRNFYQTGIT
ncbi:SDR family oxidoreductase [bacterium]|nr:MAG: SDR family oxidoreductase [bacterium]